MSCGISRASTMRKLHKQRILQDREKIKNFTHEGQLKGMEKRKKIDADERVRAKEMDEVQDETSLLKDKVRTKRQLTQKRKLVAKQ